MVFGTISRQGIRRFSTSRVLRTDDYTSGKPGATLPFKMEGKYKLTLYYTLFFGSALALPQYIISQQMKKQRVPED